VIQELIEAFTQSESAGTDKFLSLLMSLEECNNVRSYEDYYVFYGMPTYFTAGIDGLKVAAMTGIGCAPVIAGEYVNHGRMLLILRIEGVPNTDLLPFSKVRDALSQADRFKLVDNFRRMLSFGYMDARSLEDTSQWYIVDPDRTPRLEKAGRMYLFGWDRLIRIDDPEKQLEILRDLNSTVGVDPEADSAPIPDAKCLPRHDRPGLFSRFKIMIGRVSHRAGKR
jgi:hypothetical protein